jgi:hypothetical protein
MTRNAMLRYSMGVILAGLWLTACGNVEQEDFDKQLAEALCERHVHCGLYEDERTCKHAMMQEFIPRYGLGRRHEASLASGRMRFDSDAAERCLETIRESTCDLDPVSSQSSWLGFGQSDDCRFLIGTVPDGELCGALGECGPQSFCTSILRHLAFPDGPVCQRRTGQGETVPSNGVFWCAPELVAEQGVCQALAGEGESCQFPLDSRLYGSCAPGLYCTPSTRRCQRLERKGEPCFEDENFLCAWDLACVQGTCRERGGEGDDCWRSQDENSLIRGCMFDFFCDASPNSSGKCRALLKEGASCRDNQECAAGFYCAGPAPDFGEPGTCRRKALPGEACEGTWQCALAASCASGICREAINEEPAPP